MRLYLSQIREWVVEFSADTLFISMRTDVAWYRLTTCGPYSALSRLLGHACVLRCMLLDLCCTRGRT